MGRDYDNQLLESVAVRRQRLREAVLFGGQRTKRRLDENFGKITISACLAAVACAGTVGWSFVTNTLSTQRLEREQSESGPVENAIPPIPGDWVGEQVGFTMLVDELDRADVRDDLYVLPGEPRPEPGTVSSYYLVTQDEEGFQSVSVMDFDQGRPGLNFSSEDEVSRWLYQELATTEGDPRTLSSADEAAAEEASGEMSEEVRAGLDERNAESYLHTFEPGDLLDSFGPESGRHLYPDGMPFAERGLADYVRTDAAGEDLYHRYRVVHPFRVTATTAPAQGANPGGGVRFTLDTAGFFEVPPAPTLRWLIGQGYVERVSVDTIPD
ncbi:TNT domain-containing protein [Nocardiopsis sp. B62]|uniref:TNT domain-containing protein n=1 Tax=Nocardiopsis sp. B62 TaxID=2824874 RepID=UPI001B35973E|nr:TNT domain-containing protein [Nocardiopsis sp. B62]MBQ1082343.1 TNT domain-containing protein [Nocardiopsis sp. B62]